MISRDDEQPVSKETWFGECIWEDARVLRCYEYTSLSDLVDPAILARSTEAQQAKREAISRRP